MLAALTTSVDADLTTWGGLFALLAMMIVIDLKVGSARAGLTVRTAAIWSAVWVALSVLFGAALWTLAGAEAGEGYFAGYVMEKALSLDNVFVFTLIFAALAVPRDAQARLLLYGILIALVLRAAFIFAGAEALENYSWVAYPFAALLAWTGYRILRTNDDHDEGAAIADRIRRRIPMTERTDAPGLLVHENGRRLATPALAALAAIAFADVIFAVDSVPAILAITTDTFVVFAANAFALLGLRALFFLISGLVEQFRYLKAGLGVLLITIAAKLVFGELTGDKIPTAVTLAIIGGVLAVSIVASLLAARRAPGVS
ncbi:MAG: TerC/Alx family metal homeostasis membrane protein [Actinobacteria bacterium]|nr:TerC/Alx family metal homeostasis membrane protein [Actinomycetota bacterium]